MYHASIARGPHDVLILGGLKIVALVPGGPNGVRLKSCCPSRTWNADSFGWTLEVRNIFNVSWDCLMMSDHKAVGNSLSQMQSPAMV